MDYKSHEGILKVLSASTRKEISGVVSPRVNRQNKITLTQIRVGDYEGLFFNSIPENYENKNVIFVETERLNNGKKIIEDRLYSKGRELLTAKIECA